MELVVLNSDRLPHDCMDAGGRVTQEQLPKDVAVEQAMDGNVLRVVIQHYQFHSQLNTTTKYKI